jgi:predicted kinase
MAGKMQVLVGMIASGKSSYARNAARCGALVVNDDAIVNLVHGGEYTLYDQNLKVLYKSIESHIVNMASALNRKVLVDRGLNVSVKARQRWVSLARSLDMSCVAMVFENEGPEVHAKRRTDHDARGLAYEYWLKVASLHHAAWEVPTQEEGFDAVDHVSFDMVSRGFSYV